MANESFKNYGFSFSQIERLLSVGFVRIPGLKAEKFKATTPLGATVVVWSGPQNFILNVTTPDGHKWPSDKFRDAELATLHALNVHRQY